MRTYASRNAARRGILCARNGNDSSCLTHPHARTNVALDLIRELDSGDPFGLACDALYALHRLWNEYQSPAMGTSPIDAWDAGDECATYDYMAPELHALPADDAAAMIVHATAVMQRYYAAVKLAGRDY